MALHRMRAAQVVEVFNDVKDKLPWLLRHLVGFTSGMAKATSRTALWP
jgi:hypothetical protein